MPFVVALASGLAWPPVLAAETRVRVTWEPRTVRVADVALARVRGVGEGADVQGTLGGRALEFARDGDGYSTLVGFDIELKAGRQPWRVEVREPGRAPRSLSGILRVDARTFPVQRLTLPTPMVDLDPETERRAVSEIETVRRLYRTVTPERLWRGPFARPIVGDEPASGFGSRRIINGQPRSPHGGADYAAPRGTPVTSANAGRVALVAEHFFPGRLVIVDHGLGLYTLYFHLDEVRVEIGQPVVRGQVVGTVGSTGRATGPHLHFGVQVGPARVDPERLLALPLGTRGRD
jgi:murein DD-endopeptidase MepM/ murein hydrolase activator NlpD